MILPLVLAAVGSSPPVQVEIDGLSLPEGEVQRLHGQLLTRLVEAGQAIGQPGVVHLRMAGGGGVVRVEVQHGRRISFRVVEGSGAVLRLAAIHAAIDLLAEFEQSDASADPALLDPQRLVVIEATPDAEALLPAAIETTVGMGMVVVGEADRGRRVCLTRNEDDVPTLGVAPVGMPCVAEHEVSDLATVLGPLLSEPPAVAEGETEDRSSSAAPNEAIELEPEPTPPSAERPPAEAPAAWSWGVGAGAGVQGRLRAAEPLFRLEAAAYHRRGPVLLLRASLAPSGAEGLRVYDTFINAGAAWRFTPGTRFTMHVGLAAGLAVHAFDFPPRRGARVDFGAQLPMGVGVRLGRGFELALDPVLGWSTRARRHLQGGQTLWSRDRLRVGAMFVVRYFRPSGGNSTRRRRP